MVANRKRPIGKRNRVSICSAKGVSYRLVLDRLMRPPSVVEFYGVFYRVLPITGFNLTGLDWVFTSFTEFYRVLPSFTGCYRIFTEFYEVLPSFFSGNEFQFYRI